MNFETERVALAQAQGMCEMLQRSLWLTQLELNPPTNVPGCGEMAIAEQRLFDQGSAALNIAAKYGNRMCSLRKREGIICAKLRCVAGQSHSIRDFPRAINEPAVRLALDITVSGQAVGWSEFGIDFYSAAEKPERLADTHFRPPIEA